MGTPRWFLSICLKDQDLMTTAHRKLVEKTGLQSPHLEQVATVGNATRDPRGWAVTALYFCPDRFQSVFNRLPLNKMNIVNGFQLLRQKN